VNALELHLRVLSSGIICRHSWAQAMTAQHADDQLRLCAADNDRLITGAPSTALYLPRVCGPATAARQSGSRRPRARLVFARLIRLYPRGKLRLGLRGGKVPAYVETAVEVDGN
jgi:hypothetical protein